MSTLPTLEIKIPVGWNSNPLAQFFTAAFNNSVAAFARQPNAFRFLTRIHLAFKAIADGLVNPPDFLAALLLVRSHAAYLAAARLAVSGQVAEVSPVARSCLEYALYALHIWRHPELGPIWIRRNDDESSLKAVRREFQHAAVMKTLEALDKPLHDIQDVLYERTLDFGAHPNEHGVTASLTYEEAPGRKTFKTNYLHGDDTAMGSAVKTIAQIGLGSLCIFEKIFEDRFRILGVDLQIDELRQSGL